jgi:DNA-directed RNA polymerase subunit M/transcription elongation factor TFIIS
MTRRTIDRETRKAWGLYPVRIVGPRDSRCCKTSTLLVESKQGGFVSANCAKCGTQDTLSEEEFYSLNLWVNCPDCKFRLQPAKIDNNYCYPCSRCGSEIYLSDLLPPWEGLL